MPHTISGTLACGAEILGCSQSQCFMAFLTLYISLNKPQLPHVSPGSLGGDNSTFASEGTNMAEPQMIFMF